MFLVIIGILLRSLKCQTSGIRTIIIVRLLGIKVIWFVLYLYYFVTRTLILFCDFIFAIIIMIVSLENLFSFRSRYNNHHMHVHVLRSDSIKFFFSLQNSHPFLLLVHVFVCFFFFYGCWFCFLMHAMNPCHTCHDMIYM